MKRLGFTLIEIMVGVLLSSVVLGAGYNIWSASQRKFSTASTRQLLQHKTRIALDTMGADFKSVKRDTLAATNNGSMCTVKLQRFKTDLNKDQLDSEQTFEIVYEWNQTTRTLTRKANGVTKTLSSDIVGVDIKKTDTLPAGMPADSPEALAIKARIDIALTSEKRAPITGKIETHTEKVSVVMRDEFYSAANKGKYISLSELMAKASNELGVETDVAQLTIGGEITDEQLEAMTGAEINDLKDKESLCLKDIMEQYENVQKQIGEVDTENDRKWYTLWLHRSNTEFTGMQGELQNAESAKKVDEVIDKLKGGLKAREKDYIAKASGLSESDFMNGSGADADVKEEYRSALDLKLKDWGAKKAWEGADKETRGDPPPSIIENMNPSNMEKGIYIDPSGQRKTFVESTEDFNSRKTSATKVYNAAQKVDIEKLHDKIGDEGLRTYGSGQSLLDLANAKRSIVDSRDLHQKNIKTINDYQSSHPDKS